MHNFHCYDTSGATFCLYLKCRHFTWILHKSFIFSRTIRTKRKIAFVYLYFYIIHFFYLFLEWFYQTQFLICMQMCVSDIHHLFFTLVWFGLIFTDMQTNWEFFSPQHLPTSFGAPNDDGLIVHSRLIFIQ